MCVYMCGWLWVGVLKVVYTCIQVSLAITCLFVWAVVGWVTLPFSFFRFSKNQCDMHMYFHA